MNYLDASHNRLKSLPDTIGNLSNLELFDASHNELERIPDTIGNLANLKHIDLTDNALVALPETIANCPSLNLLNVAGNQLSTIPESLAHVPQEFRLKLTHNPIESFPAACRDRTLPNFGTFVAAWIDLNVVRMGIEHKQFLFIPEFLRAGEPRKNPDSLYNYKDFQKRIKEEMESLGYDKNTRTNVLEILHMTWPYEDMADWE